ncbi:protein CHROMATIN REMODELING 4 isoform X4 [Physcomitrium patens]|uniref:protein CHROMATIN REMODELING 4 isoform X4 n=1 Tax=Physcomitrium patens TaxID=3218 RepID=UPI000D1573A5|nr:uncharacterized protein LOC112290881 isoform X4 [Physcomitrium patens]|eukprot:XP_024393478.1 uncharacterized protein LOC112290881 isoform X4 [Physcomitrella patens]
MEALEKPKEKRTKSGGPHGIKSKSATVDHAATHQHVRLRIKLPVSPARNLAGSTKGAKSSTGASVATNHEPATSDPSDHKSGDTEPTSPAPEYQDFSNTSLKELRRRYEAKFGTATLSNNSDYLKRKLAGQCGPPRLRRTNVEHDVTVEKSPKKSPTSRRRKVEDILEPEARVVGAEEDIDVDVEVADGEDEDSDPDCGVQDGDASTPLKKQRSGRKDGGANQWTSQAEEIRRIVRKKRRNRAFPPQTLVWAKLEERPWWPARVVNLEELPESVLEKKLVGWTCVELYGLPTDEQRFAWLQRENLASYKKFRKDFNEQKFPERFEDGNFQLALKDISDEAKRRRTADNTAVGTKSLREERDSSMEVRSSNSSSSDEDESEAPLRLGKETLDTGKKHLKHRTEIGQGKLKQMRMKKVHGLQVEDMKQARSMCLSKGEEDATISKLKKTKDNGGDMTRKRKRLVADEQMKDDSQGSSDEAEDVTIPESPPTKAVSDSKLNRQSIGKKLSRSLSNAGDSVKVDKDGSRKPKRTGEDGYYYDCEVCGIGGELLCCDLCPRVYHLECLTPPLKRTPPGKWVCPTCRDRSGVVRAAGNSFADARQQSKVKGVEDPSARAGNKVWRKEKSIGPPVVSSEKISKRRREDADSKRRRKRAKSKGEEDSGQRKLNCGYCGVETFSLRSSGLCDKCHPEIRAGTVDDNPSNSTPAECVETIQLEKDELKSGRCHSCGERGVDFNCGNCSCAFHKDCVVPPLRRMPKNPWFCSSCSSGGDHDLGDEQPFDALSAEQVHCILGCRVPACQGLPTSRCVTEMDKDRQLKVYPQKVEEGNVNGSLKNILEGPGDAAGMEWKVVKRKQSSDVNPTGGAQTAVPMEIDSLSGAGAGAAILNTERKSLDLEEEEPETKTVVSEIESVKVKTSALTNPKEKNSSKLSSSGVVQVEDPSFVIEIGGHYMNLNVQLPLDSVTKTDENASNKEIACGGLSNSLLQQSKDTTRKIKEFENGKITSSGVAPTEAAEKKGNPDSLCDINATGTDGQVNLSPSLEFLVKWRDRSHIHNEWVSEERLRTIAKRKLEKYKLKYGTDPLILMDDECLKPQRILATRVGKNGSAEVLVKWHSQPYDACTWEDKGHPVVAKNLELLQVFERFEAAAVTKTSNMMTNENRPSGIEELTVQPEWLRGGGILFPHQLEALNWLRKSWYHHKKVILADEMGLGKTISACAFLASLYREFRVNAPCLVLVPLSTMSNWLAEFSVWAPFLNVIEYHGSVKARAVIREYEWYSTTTGKSGNEGKRPDSQIIKFDVMLTSYEMVISDSNQLRSIPWEVLIVDEGQRLKNSESKLFTLLNTYKFGHRVLLTGTPLQNNLSEMYNLLNFLQPETFPSQGAFEEKFGSLSTAEQVDELKKLVAPHMLRRLKKDVMQNIPPKAERVVPVELTPVQAEYYRALLTKNYQLLRQVGGCKPGGQNQSLLNIMMQLRKVCNHPYLLPGSEPEGGSPKFFHEMRIKASAKLTLLHSMLRHLKRGGHRVLIFSQMTKLLDILEEYMVFEFGAHSYERVDGSVPVAERQKSISRFNQDQSRFVFLLSTRSCGLGINLATADTVIIYDSDFNPHADIQAMNRAHRIGQSKTLLVYRLVVRASVEERILQLARKKLMLEYLFANKSGSQKEVEDIIRWGTEELFAGDSLEESRALLNAEVGATEEVRRKPLDETCGKSSGLDREIKDDCKDGMLSQDKVQKKAKAAKVIWDDVAVSRLLDRSDLATTNMEVAEGDQGGDWLGSLKTWTWNEQDCGEQMDNEEDSPRDIEIAENPLNPSVEQNKWEELLRLRWEKLQKEEEAALGRGKRTRKNVLYNESQVLKLEEESSGYSEEDLDRDHSSEPVSKPVPRVKQPLGKVRADDQDLNIKDDTQSSFADEGKPVSGSFKTPASSSSNPLTTSFSQIAAHETEERSPTFQGTHRSSSAKVNTIQTPITIDLEDTPRTMPSISIINVEQSRNGNVSYPHRVYTVPGTPVRAAGEQSLVSSKHHVPSPLLSSEQIDPDLSTLRKQLDKGPQSSLSSQAIRQLLSPAIQGSSGQYGSAGHSNIRSLVFDGVSGSRVPQPVSEERVFDNPGNRRHDADLQGLQPDLLQRAYAREGQNSAMLSTSGVFDVPHASSIKDSRDATGSVTVSELLRRVSNKKGGSMLPPASSDGRHSSQFLSNDVLPNVLGTNQSSQGSPNLSMSLGFGGLNLSGQDQGLLVRARASHDSQKLARSHNKTGTSLGVPSSLCGSGDVTRVQGGDALLVSGGSDHHEGRSSDGSLRLLSGSQDMVGLPSLNKYELSKRSSPFGETYARFKQGSHVEPWTEDELDSLWTGVRRLGCGNWAAMLLDRRLNFHKSRTAHDLAERWREEQMKLFGPSPADIETKPVRQGYSPLSSAEDGIGHRNRDHTSAGEESYVKNRKGSADSFERFPKETIDLTGTSTIINQAIDRKQVLETLRAVDLSYRRSSGMTGNPAIDRVEYSKVPESSSALDLVNSVRPQGSAVRESGSASRSGLAMEGHSIDFDKWEGTTSRRRIDVPKEMLRQSQLPKTKLPASFLANLSASQSIDAREKQSQELRDQHTLPLLPQVSAPGLGLLDAGQSSSGSFPHKASFSQQMQQDNISLRGFHDSPRNHDSRASSLSSTFAELDKRRLKIGLGSSKNSDAMGSNEASQSLPHWLREAFKPDQPPPPPPKVATVSPMITAVAQATSFLYKDCVPFLTPFVHPGTLPAPPRRAAKKRKSAAGEAESGRGTEVVSVRNELNFLMSGVESTNPSLSSSLQQFASSLNAGFNTGGQTASAPSTSSFSKRHVDFSALPSLDTPAQPSFSKPIPALEELMSLKNLPSLPSVAPPLDDTVTSGLERSFLAQSSAQVLDTTSAGQNIVFSSRSERHGAKDGRHRNSNSFPVNKHSLSLRKGDIGAQEVIHLRRRHEARTRKRKSTTFSFASAKLPSYEGSPDSPHKHRQDGSGESQLPGWMIAADVGTKSRQKASSKKGDGNSSSETESDPRIRGAAGMAGADDDDASSDETVSDDRTQ